MDTQWVEELREQISKGTLYWQLDQQMDSVRVCYMALYHSLLPEQQKVLNEYIRLMKQLEVCMTRTAYLIGVEHGSKHK